jgi:NADH-quinone oxidoreductase subunit L
MHHDQDIRNMGGLRKYMPKTWITFLIGSLALIGTPFLSGFYSKDTIIEAVELSHLPVAHVIYYMLMLGVFVTAFYSFRLYFLVFHGKERFGKAHPSTGSGHTVAAHDSHDEAHGDAHAAHDEHHGLAPGQKPHETPWVVWLPLVLLAIPSLGIGYFTIEPMLYGNYFQGAIYVNEVHNGMRELAEEFHGPLAAALHAFTSLPFLLALSGVAMSWFFYLKRPDIPAAIKQRFSLIYSILERKYGFDEFNDWFFAGGARGASRFLWTFGDVKLIDGLMVNGSARLVGMLSGVLRRFQTGYIYHYAFSMIIGVFVLLTIRELI